MDKKIAAAVMRFLRQRGNGNCFDLLYVSSSISPVVMEKEIRKNCENIVVCCRLLQL